MMVKNDKWRDEEDDLKLDIHKKITSFLTHDHKLTGQKRGYIA